MNIGLIGAGSIGRFLLEKLNGENNLPGYKITAVFDDREKNNVVLTKLAEQYNFTIFDELSSFLKSPIDLVVECANIEVVEKYARQICNEKDQLIISVGALADSELYESLQLISNRTKRKVYLPTGAIGGLDVLRAANSLGGLDTVTLVTRKPAQALSDVPVDQETIVFEGSAKDAIAMYPKNANIAIILSLSGIGVEKTKVKIIADPHVTKNIHKLEAIGDFGELKVQLKNNPSPNNSKTSFLTGLSVLATLGSLDQSMVIG